MTTIKVVIKNVYGVDKIYPVCDKAKLFAQLLGQATLTPKGIPIIKQLGYTIEVTNNTPKAL